MEYNGISTFKKTYNRNGLFFMPTLEVGNQVSGPESPVSSLGVPLLLQGSMQPSGQQQEGPNVGLPTRHLSHVEIPGRTFETTRNHLVKQ